MDERQQFDLQQELELRTVTSLLKTPDWIGEAAESLREDDFETEDAAALFAAARRLFLDGQPVTAVSVAVEAGDGRNDLLHALMRSTLEAAGHEEFLFLCESLRSRSRVRRLNTIAFRLAQTTEPELAAHLVDELNGAMSRRRETRVVTTGQAGADFLNALDEKPDYLPWGIRRLDEELHVEAGDFVVIGGYASSGKTLLSLQMAAVLAESRRVGYFSLETSCRKLYERLAAHMSQVSFRRIKRRDLRAADVDALTRAASELNRRSLDLVNAGGMSVTDIQAVTLQRRYEVIFVDYLQLADAPGRDRYEKVTAISIALHTLAQTHGVTVIALAQLSRPEKMKARDGKPVPPSMSSFRESGQIEQDADVAMLLYPSDPDDNGSTRILKVSKNKDGEKLSIELTFDGATQTMTPVSGDRAAARKFSDAGRRAKQAYRSQTVPDGFADITDTEKEALPF